MTPKERMNAAMNLQPVDKTPVMCQMSMGHMLQQLDESPIELWFDKDVFANSLIRLREQYEFDGILVSLHGHNPEWRELINEIETTEKGEIAELKNGDKIIFPDDDLPQYKFANPRVDVSLDDITEDDLPEELDYIPVSVDLHFHIDHKNKFSVLEDLVKSHGNDFSIHGEITSPFDYLLDLAGYQNSLLGLVMQPDKCKMILNHFTRLIKNLAVEMCKTGVDAVKISSPFAGAGFISPDNYREFVLPYEKEIVSAIREKGVHTYIHTCGSIGDRLELMFESGMSGIECLDPPPIGNVELDQAVETISNKGFIKGNLDSVNTLMSDNQDVIIEDVKKRLEIGNRNAGFILSTACSIAPNVKKENIQLLKQIVDAR